MHPATRGDTVHCDLEMSTAPKQSCLHEVHGFTTALNSGKCDRCVEPVNDASSCPPLLVMASFAAAKPPVPCYPVPYLDS